MATLLILGLIALLVLGFPIGISMGIVSVYYLIREGIPLEIAIQQMYQGTNVFVLLAIPLFMVASSLMNQGTITERLINLCDSLLGHVRGGLAHVNVLVSMIFAGMSGSALADTAGIGGILIPEMIKQGYDKDFTVAVTADFLRHRPHHPAEHPHGPDRGHGGCVRGPDVPRGSHARLFVYCSAAAPSCHHLRQKTVSCQGAGAAGPNGA